MLYERIVELCEDHNTTPAELERELGFPRATLTRWKTAEPGFAKVVAVAKYFGASIDWLAGLSTSKYNAHMVLEDRDMVSIQRARENMTTDQKSDMMMLLRIGFKEAFTGK